MRLIVCGGRDFTDSDFVHNALCEIDSTRGPVTCVIHGAATGADHEAMIWAQTMAESGRQVTHAPYVANWAKYQRVASGRMKLQNPGRTASIIPFPGTRREADNPLPGPAGQASAKGDWRAELAAHHLRLVQDIARFRGPTE